MSVLNRSPKQAATEEIISQVDTCNYKGNHPMLQYSNVSVEKKRDHLDNYVEVRPFENTEDEYADYVPDSGIGRH
tara:strand:+ start:1707 stop:1931 length:225 start_codon:yes stop_codon:yes gene_type:complete